MLNPDIPIKSGFMLGLGETEEEISDIMSDIVNVGCDVLTIGQYLSPARNIRHKEVAKFYSPAHFFLLPSSSSEGWPKVLSEAMAYGVVPIASSISSIPQILREAGSGKTFPPDKIISFVNAILGYIHQAQG